MDSSLPPSTELSWWKSLILYVTGTRSRYLEAQESCANLGDEVGQLEARLFVLAGREERLKTDAVSLRHDKEGLQNELTSARTDLSFSKEKTAELERVVEEHIRTSAELTANADMLRSRIHATGSAMSAFFDAAQSFLFPAPKTKRYLVVISSNDNHFVVWESPEFQSAYGLAMLNPEVDLWQDLFVKPYERQNVRSELLRVMNELHKTPTKKLVHGVRVQNHGYEADTATAYNTIMRRHIDVCTSVYPSPEGVVGISRMDFSRSNSAGISPEMLAHVNYVVLEPVPNSCASLSAIMAYLVDSGAAASRGAAEVFNGTSYNEKNPFVIDMKYMHNYVVSSDQAIDSLLLSVSAQAERDKKRPASQRRIFTINVPYSLNKKPYFLYDDALPEVQPQQPLPEISSKPPTGDPHLGLADG